MVTMRKIDKWWFRKSPQGENNLFNIIETIEKCLCSLWATQNLFQIVFIDAASCLPPPSHQSFCGGGDEKWCRGRVRSFPSHFTEIRARGRRDLLAIFWVFVQPLPHFHGSERTSAPRRPRIRMSLVSSPNENKRHDRFRANVINGGTGIRRGWGEAAPGMWERVGGGEEAGFPPFSRSHSLEEQHQHVGAFPPLFFSSEAAVMKERWLSGSPLTSGSGSERGIPGDHGCAARRL